MFNDHISSTSSQYHIFILLTRRSSYYFTSYHDHSIKKDRSSKFNLFLKRQKERCLWGVHDNFVK